MGLITIADVEVATGEDISLEDEPRIQWYIDVVSNHIKTYINDDFLEYEDQELICQADGSGIIEFNSQISISKVELLDQWEGTYEEILSGGYRFDGLSKILYLVPRATYRVTATYGSETVPADIKDVVTQLVLAGSGLDAAAVAGLKAYRIGDKEEEYGVSAFDGGPVVTLGMLQRKVLDKYRSTERTWRL